MFSVVYYDSNQRCLPVSPRASMCFMAASSASWSESVDVNYMEQPRNSSSILLSIPGFPLYL